VVLRADAPPGDYTLRLGMYDVRTLGRLPAVRAGQRLPDDQIPLAQITVSGG
jgi:hypothetical protein